MTVSSTISKVSYSGDDSTVSFPIPFNFTSNADIVAVLADADGNETTWTITTDYTLTGAGGTSGGTLTAFAAPATGETLVIYRDPEIKQLVDYVENDPFSADTHEGALDKLTYICQALDEKVGRALLQPVTSSGSNVTFAPPDAGKVLLWNATGTAVTNGPDADEIANAQSYAEAAAASAATVPTFPAITGEGGKYVKINAGGTAFEYDALYVSAFIKTLLDDADAATARATLVANIMRCGAYATSNTSRTLGASDLGKHHHTYASPTLTLPPFSVCENGSMLLISCYSGVATISRNGTEALFTTSSVTSFTLNPGDFAILTTNATNAWSAIICRATVAQDTGCVIAVASETVPTGYLECNGAAVSRTTYASLFAAIGIIHGQGDGSTTFNLPDYRGRFLRGWAHGSTLDPNRASRTAMATGGQTGDHVGSVQADEFKAHTHNVSCNDAATGDSEVYINAKAGNFKTTSSTGGDETRPTNANVMFCIKY